MSEKNPNQDIGLVIKSILDPLAGFTDAVNGSPEGVLYWGTPQQSYWTLYQVSAEHSACIQRKADGAFGRGLEGAGKARIESLCKTGSADLFSALGLDLETYGNAFIGITRIGKKVTEIYRLPARTMYRHIDLKRYVQVVNTPNGQRQLTLFNADEVLHLRGLCPGGEYYAYPSWISAGGMLELVYAAIRYNAAFFKNNAKPEYVIVSKGSPLGESQKAAAKDFFTNEFKGMDNAHKTLYLHLSDPESSIEIKPVSAQMKDGDFLKLLDAAKERIPIAHGVPPRMIGIVTAGQLGGGGELVGQLFAFENLTLQPMRRRMINLLKPLLDELGLSSADLAFTPLDITPPDIDAQISPAVAPPLPVRGAQPTAKSAGLSRREIDALMGVTQDSQALAGLLARL